jgi:hypothetical protein
MTSRHTEPDLRKNERVNVERWTDRWDASQFIDIRVENPVHETDARTLVGILIGQLDVNLPVTASERCYHWLVDAEF